MNRNKGNIIYCVATKQIRCYVEFFWNPLYDVITVLDAMAQCMELLLLSKSQYITVRSGFQNVKNSANIVPLLAIFHFLKSQYGQFYIYFQISDHNFCTIFKPTAYCMWQHSTMHGVFQNLTFPHLKRNYKMVAYSLKMYHFNNAQALVNNFNIGFTLT